MFEWDTEKAKENKRKHKVAFEMVERFDFDTALEIDITDMREDGERRWQAIGFIDARLFVLVYTERGAARRVISLRGAEKKEHRIYEHNS